MGRLLVSFEDLKVVIYSVLTKRLWDNLNWDYIVDWKLRITKEHL